MSGGVDSAVSAYLLKKQGYLVEGVFMNNWDAREEDGKNCTLTEDLKSIEKTCKVLGITKLHHVNYQSQYWQRVFTPVLDGYESGCFTPNPDILCNREIKFGELYDWAVEGAGRADFLATGHYARISNGTVLRQAKDLGKDQTYFLAAINRECLKRTMFPVGDLMKSTKVKEELVMEAGLNHLTDRKESMGLCFIGKRGKFSDFMANFVPGCGPGPIINLDTGEIMTVKHKGLNNYTIGQNVAVSGAKSRLYLAAKDKGKNSLLVVDNQSHPSLWASSINVESSIIGLSKYKDLYCSIRSVDKTGTRVKSILSVDDCTTVELEEKVYAPCAGQWAVFYTEDESSMDNGRICLGASPII